MQRKSDYISLELLYRLSTIEESFIFLNKTHRLDKDYMT